MNSNFKKIQGSSLLELLVALGIFMPLLTGLTYTYIRFSKLVFKENNFDKRINSEYLLRAYTRQLMYDLDSHRLPLFPVVHPRGRIQLADGANLKLSAANQPAPDSSAITGFEVELQRSMYVTEITAGSIRICPRYEKSLLKDQIQILAVSPEGITEVTIKVLDPEKNTLCKKIIIIGSGGVLTPEYEVAVSKNLIFVPLQRVYTLYRSKRDELRLLTHAGKSIVENQRITNNLEKMNLRLLPAAEDSVKVLELDFQISATENKKVLLSHALSRFSLAQFIYERP